MQWILFLVIAAIGYGFSRFIRNYFVDTALKRYSVGVMCGVTVWIHLAIAILLTIIYGFDTYHLEPLTILGLMLAGAVQILFQFPYFAALKAGDTVEVTIFTQISPIIALILGFFFLGQSISMRQFIGFGLIIFAALLLVFRNKHKRTQKAKLKTIGHVLLSSTLWVISDVAFSKFLGDETSGNLREFARRLLFFEFGAIIASILFLALNPSWIKALKTVMFGKRGKQYMSLTILNVIAYGGAEIFYRLAIVSAPAIALLSAIEHVFELTVTFLLGIILSHFFPSFGREKLQRSIIIRYVLAILIIIAGVLLIQEGLSFSALFGAMSGSPEAT